MFQRTGAELVLDGSAMSIAVALAKRKPEVIFEIVLVRCRFGFIKSSSVPLSAKSSRILVTGLIRT